MTLKEQFQQRATAVFDSEEGAKILSVAVKLPTGATEVITNTELLSSKADYYINQYDEDFRLKANSTVQIVAFMLV